MLLTGALFVLLMGLGGIVILFTVNAVMDKLGWGVTGLGDKHPVRDGFIFGVILALVFLFVLS